MFKDRPLPSASGLDRVVCALRGFPLPVVPVLLALAALSSVSCGGPDRGEVLARAGGLELTVQEAAELLGGRETPPDEETVITKAELWVDYVLVALAASEDETLSNVDVTGMAREQLEQGLVTQLGTAVIQVDTAVTERDLQRLFYEELPGGSVRGRQILLNLPQGATKAVRDSVFTLARDLKARVEGGEDFGALAMEFSSDAGTREKEGDLGQVSRGQLAGPLEEALFRLPEGVVSEPLETVFGVHLLQVQERIPGEYEDQRASFRTLIQRRRLAEAQAAFLEEITERGELEILDGAVDRVREALAQAPSGRGAWEASEPLARHAFGDYSVGDLIAFARTREPGYRTRLQRAEDDLIERTIWTLARGDLLLKEAAEQGMRISPEELKAMSGAIKEQLLEKVFQFGFLPFGSRPGESRRAAVDRIVAGAVEPIFKGESGVHLRRITPELEKTYGAAVYVENAGKVLELLK